MKIRKLLTLFVMVAISMLVLAACSGSSDKKTSEASPEKGDYPDGPIEMIVGFGEGGGTDTMARSLQPHFQEALGVNVAVRNMPGASSALALEKVNEKPADGQTILFQTDLVRVFPAMGMTDLTYKDFEQIGIGAMGIANFVVGENSELNDFSDVVELLKSGDAKVGIAGNGDPWHVTLEIVNNVVGGDAEIITYDSGANAGMAVLKGEVDFSITGVNEVVDLLRSGDARSLAVMDSEPFDVSDYGEIPPVTETISGLEAHVPEGTWWGPAVKKDTPEHIVDNLKEIYQEAIFTDEFKEFAEKNAIVLIDTDDPQEKARLDTEKISWLLYEIGAGERSPEEVGIEKPEE